MGLLDDAIREHLELKRKHGAGDEELRRQETEALGPARRDFTAPAEGGEEPAPALPPDEPEPAPAEPAGWLDDEQDDGAFAAPAEPAGAVPVERAAEAPFEPVEHAAEAADPTLAQEPVATPDPVVPQEEPPPEPAPPRESHTPTQGFPAVSREDEPEEAGEEDVLEETPEFLQDTPEHDRLWFEQKPPRDFDFDD